MRIGVYAGSFDPITKGHYDVIKKSLRIADKVIVAVMNNTNKNCWFTLEERKNMVKMLVDHFGDKVEVKSFDGLLIDFMKQNNADIIIRGLRAVSDFEYELGYAFVNHDLSYGDIETIFIPAAREYMYLSSSGVREAASVGARLDIFVDDKLIDIIREKAKSRKK
ncbi:Phosphopantetheine adenylyltransferase [Fusobacterium sp. DD29]|uniref:pantetheine-phosphate adenylyltransferase n=1 Tax=unclassified Fusobacterium TaxID=2648384 RepID=UPI001B8BCAAD|nr:MULTISPECIES: pantetheine-phosphate adenylyltransferase [unclassified Fusobacterium]MBR8701212.1 Phosphopantetheine adenylyltransferase [Fusobacterium sp. DD45]MBR8710952.1 Phosphopantetheine adenylyltransferase [Fusobacterium sp. DD28]MBR8750190.1 Phosphopantetheine adenylyltransferase [Fusobacterium sp. DD29]MBR8751526.1 Phosphopantetheine adenylyltransferase [Fusobacterium sp. DD26]MBR8762432.1 Phosphopantetheine adenylyltransferase [Fusobacterium sp. DD25]